MRRYFFHTICIGIFAIGPVGCAKERFSIGRGAPAQEIEQCITLSEKKRFEDAIQCLEIFKSRFAGSAEAQEAELKIADNYYGRKEYLLAAETYGAFLKLYPLHPKADYAHYRIGLAYFMESPKSIDRDQGYLDDALASFDTVLSRYPQGSYAEAAKHQRTVVRGRIGRRHFYIGNFYYRTGEYKAAIPRLLEVLVNYPEVGQLEEIAYKTVAANTRLGRVEDAKAVYTKMVEAFPTSAWTKRAERRLLRVVDGGHRDAPAS